MVINKIETNKPYEIHMIAEAAFLGITIFGYEYYFPNLLSASTLQFADFFGSLLRYIHGGKIRNFFGIEQILCAFCVEYSQNCFLSKRTTLVIIKEDLS